MRLDGRQATWLLAGLGCVLQFCYLLYLPVTLASRDTVPFLGRHFGPSIFLESLAMGVLGSENGVLAWVLLFPLVAMALYGVALWVAGTSGGDVAGRRVILGFALLNIATLVLQPGQTSSDFYYYLASSRFEVLHGQDPFTTVMTSHPGDPLVQLGFYMNLEVATPYGTFFTLLCSTLVRMVGPDPLAEILAYKGFVGLVVAANLFVLDRVLGKLCPQRRNVRLLMFAWNPAIMIETAGECHVDAVLVLLVMGGLWAVLERRAIPAAALLTVAALTKPFLGVLPLAYLVYLYRRGERRGLALAVLGIVLTVAVLLIPYGPGAMTSWQWAMRFLRDRYPTSFTLLLTVLVLEIGRRLDFVVALPPLWKGIHLALWGTYFVGLALALSRLRGSTSHFLRFVADAISTFIIFVSPSFWGWYLTIPLALVTLAPSARMATGVVAVTCVTLYQHQFRPLDMDVVQRLRFMFPLLGLPVILGVVSWWRHRGEAQDSDEGD